MGPLLRHILLFLRVLVPFSFSFRLKNPPKLFGLGGHRASAIRVTLLVSVALPGRFKAIHTSEV